MRAACMIAQCELLAKATMCKQFSDAHTSTFAQATAAQYLEAGRMPGTLANVRKVYGERAASWAPRWRARSATPSNSPSRRASCSSGPG
jgi:DNA-binding transcriptional MocR family regulator